MCGGFNVTSSFFFSFSRGSWSTWKQQQRRREKGSADFSTVFRCSESRNALYSPDTVQRNTLSAARHCNDDQLEYNNNLSATMCLNDSHTHVCEHNPTERGAAVLVLQVHERGERFGLITKMLTRHQEMFL